MSRVTNFHTVPTTESIGSTSATFFCQKISKFPKLLSQVGELLWVTHCSWVSQGGFTDFGGFFKQKKVAEVEPIDSVVGTV